MKFSQILFFLTFLSVGIWAQPAPKMFWANGGNGTVDIAVATDAITVTAPDWVQIFSQQGICANGSCTAYVGFTVAPNPSFQQRRGSLAVNGSPTEIRQDGFARVVNSADYSARLARGAYGSFFGDNLGSNPIITLTQLSGARQYRKWWPTVIFTSATQINLVLPSDLENARYVVQVSSDTNQASAEFTIDSIAPALFSMNQRGDGQAVGNVQRNWGDYTAYTDLAISGQWLTDPGEYYLLLYGTGIRDQSIAIPDEAHFFAVVNGIVAANPIIVPVLYAGVQGQYEGLDQINLPLQLPAGEYDFFIKIDGHQSNTLRIKLNASPSVVAP